MKFIKNKDPKTRKICIDTFYTLCAIDKNHMKDFQDQLHSSLLDLKTDKNKLVREAAMECLKVIGPGKKTKPSYSRVDMKRSVPRPRPKIVKKTKSRNFVNKKIKLDHVKSTIDKCKINSNFIKSHSVTEDVIIMANKPKNDIDFKDFYEKNEQNLLEHKTKNVKSPKNKNLFETVPDFNRTDQT